MTESKNEYVRRQPQDRRHTCHWPKCQTQVPPAMWGCKPHWFKLPKALRDKVWSAYIPGQEQRGDPSDEYLDVALEVQVWIEEHGTSTSVAPEDGDHHLGDAFVTRLQGIADGCRQEGWDSYHAAPVTDAALTAAGEAQPVPTNSGGIQVEWHTPIWDVEVEFGRDGELLSVLSQRREH